MGVDYFEVGAPKSTWNNSTETELQTKIDAIKTPDLDAEQKHQKTKEFAESFYPHLIWVYEAIKHIIKSPFYASLLGNVIECLQRSL